MGFVHIPLFRYFGLSSSGITYKSGSASSGSSSFQSGDKYGGLSGTKDSDTFKDSYKENDRSGEEKFDQSTSTKSRRAVTSENQGITLKKGSTHYGRFVHSIYLFELSSDSELHIYWLWRTQGSCFFFG